MVALAAIGSRSVSVPSWNSTEPFEVSIRSSASGTESSVPSMPESCDALTRSRSLPPGYETRSSAVRVNGTLATRLTRISAGRSSPFEPNVSVRLWSCVKTPFGAPTPPATSLVGTVVSEAMTTVGKSVASDEFSGRRGPARSRACRA